MTPLFLFLGQWVSDTLIVSQRAGGIIYKRTVNKFV